MKIQDILLKSILLQTRMETNSMSTSASLDLQLINYVNTIKSFFGKHQGYPKELDDLTLFTSSELTKEEKTIFLNAYRKVKKKTYMKNCFLNSLQLSMADKTNTIKLVEGYAYKYIPMEHSWNSINGKLIDITFNISDGLNPYLGVIPDNVAYYGHIFNDLNLLDWYKFANVREEFSLFGRSGRDYFEKKKKK